MYVIYYYQVLGEYGKVNLRSFEVLQQQVRKLATSIIISSQHDNNMYPFSKLELLCQNTMRDERLFKPRNHSNNAIEGGSSMSDFFQDHDYDAIVVMKYV